MCATSTGNAFGRGLQTPCSRLHRAMNANEKTCRAISIAYAIRKLRNRVFHYEPLWHWHDLADQHALAVNLLKWLNPDMADVLAAVDRFAPLHSQGEVAAPLLVVAKP